MGTDWIQWSSVLIVSFSLCSPQWMVTDALQVAKDSKNHSCDENDTFTWLDSARRQWPSLPFEPYDLLSQSEFVPMVTPSSHVDLRENPKATVKVVSSSGYQINQTPVVLRILISTSPLLLPNDLESKWNTPRSDESWLISSSIIQPTSLTISSVQSTPIIDRSISKDDNRFYSVTPSFSSSPIEPSFYNSGSFPNPPSSAAISNVTFPVFNSHPVSHHLSHQPAGSQVIYRLLSTAIETNLTNDNLPSTISNGNGTLINEQFSTASSPIDILASTSFNQPDLSRINNSASVSSIVSTSTSLSSCSEKRNSLPLILEQLNLLPTLMITISLIVFIFCSLLTLIVWRKNRRLRSSSPNSSSGALDPLSRGDPRLKGKSSMAKPVKVNTKESLVNWRKVSGPGSNRSFIGHGGSRTGLNISGGCSATSGTIDSNHEFEYLSFDSPSSSLKIRTAEYRPRRPYSSFQSHGFNGSSSRLELTKEKVIPIGELDEIAELSSNGSSQDHHPHHQHPGSRITYVTTKEEMIGDYENPLMRPGIDEVDCSIPQLIQVHMSEQTQNIIQAIRSELKKFNLITGNNVQSQSQPSTATQFKEPTSSSDA